MKEKEKQIERELRSQDWGEIGPKLLAFAEFRARMYRWSRGTTEILPKGHTLKDVVQKVIIKTINRDRKWDPDKGDLVPWLLDQVKSELDALAKSASHKYEGPIVENDPGTSDDNAYQVQYELVERQTPETILLEKEERLEREQQAKRKVDSIFQAIEDDAELEELVNAMMEGHGPKPRFLAEALNVEVEDIYKRRKRLLRRVGKAPGGTNE